MKNAIRNLLIKVGVLRLSFEASEAIQVRQDIVDRERFIALVPNVWITNSGKARRLKRRQLVKIINRDTGLETFRPAVGSGRHPGVTGHTIALDYDGLAELGMAQKGARSDTDIIIQPASFSEAVGHFWGHPDIGYRISTRLSVLVALASMLLGWAMGKVI